jgi:proton glutamate symport protein
MKRVRLAHAIIAAMLLGIAIGALWPTVGVRLQPLEVIFLRLIRVVVGPLVFATIVAGIGAHSNLRQSGRLAIKAIVYFELVTTVALFIGLVAANLSQPGRGISLAAAKVTAHSYIVAGQTNQPRPASVVDEMIEHAVPQSFADALARGEILQVVVFSLLFAVALSATGARGRPVLVFCESLAQVMFRFTNYVMWVAPFGVLGALASSVGSHGFAVLLPLLKLNLAMYAALVVFLMFLAAIVVALRIPLARLARAIREPFLIAFSAASSEAALPVALENMERFGVPGSIAGFVIPTGYSFNIDGSTLYLSFAFLFIAQAAGAHLALGRQLVVLLTLMLSSKGVAGVARGAYPILAATVASFGLPMEGVALLLGVDHFMDMGRSAVNVVGNCVASAVVARWEGRLATSAPMSSVPAEETIEA